MMKFATAIAVALAFVAVARADGHEGSMGHTDHDDHDMMIPCDMDGLMACGSEVMSHYAYGRNLDAFMDFSEVEDFCNLVAEAWDCATPILDTCSFDDIYMLTETGNSYRFMCRPQSLEVIQRNWDCLRSDETIDADASCNASITTSLTEMYMKYMGMSSAEIDRDEVDRDACMHYKDAIECFTEAGAVCGEEVSTLAAQWSRAAFRDSIRYHQCMDRHDHDSNGDHTMYECDQDALMTCGADVVAHPAWGRQVDAFESMDDVREFCGLVATAWDCATPIMDMCPFDDIYQLLETANGYRFMCRPQSLEAIERNWDCVRGPEFLGADAACNASIVAHVTEMYMKYMEMNPEEIDRDEVDRDACMISYGALMCYTEAGALCGEEMRTLAAQWTRAAMRDTIRHHRCMEMAMDDDSSMSEPESEPEDDSSEGGRGSQGGRDSEGGRGSQSRPDSRCDFDGIMECTEDIMMKKGYDRFFDAFESMDEIYDLCSVVPATAMCVERRLERCTFDEAFQILEKKNGYQFMCRMDTLQGIAENFECISGRRQSDNDRMCNATINRQMMEMYYQAMEENWDREEQDMRACIFMRSAVNCFADGAMDACGGDASELYYRWAMASMKDSWEYHMCDMREETGGAGHVAAGVLSLLASLAVFA